MSNELERSWLVQRLNAPSKGTGRLAKLSEAFSFGGGLHNGGLSEDAMGLLREVWSFDYMGAAEFEWGAVPEALQKIAKTKKLIGFSLTIPQANIPDGWRGEKAEKDGEVYVLCPQGLEDQVSERIKEFVPDDSNVYQQKKPTRLASALRTPRDELFTPCGWLELNNGFLFFTDREMYEKTAKLFGVEL